jgi:hypothetical protein
LKGIRLAARLVPVALLLGLAPAAAAAVQEGAVTDERDVLPVPAGVASRPDVESIRVSYDSDRGDLELTVGLWEPLGENRGADWSLVAGSVVRADGVCRAEGPGDVPSASGYLYRLGAHYGAATATPFGASESTSATASSDGREFTYAFSGVPGLIGGTWACVGAIVVGEGDGRDEVKPICLTRCRPDPAQDGPDPRRPSIDFEAPEHRETVFGTWRERTRDEPNHCEAIPEDNRGIESVDFLLDGYALNIEYLPPYSCVWDSSVWSDGRHELRAVVHDTSGNATDDRIRITVDNAGRTPPPWEEPPPRAVEDLVPAPGPGVGFGTTLRGTRSAAWGTD